MNINIKRDELTSLLKSFYELSRIRIVFFDKEFNELFGYPEEHSSFCSTMRKNPRFDEKCVQSASSMCLRCKEANKLITETCHAGLCEVVAPLIKDNIVMGYIMFGQIRSEENENEFMQTVKARCGGNGLTAEEIEKLARSVHYKTHRQIESAAEIINVFLSYIYTKEIVNIKKDNLAYFIINHIKNNLGNSLSTRDLCDRFHISRTTLYEITKPYAPYGIASFVKKKRIEKAKELLASTDKDIEEISSEVGFNDSDYFRRVFKKHVGVSANRFRKKIEV